MGDIVLAIALFTLLDIPTDFGPADIMIFSAPPLNVRLLHPPQDINLTRELIEFAKRRPYHNSIPNWWNQDTPTVDVAIKLQEYEEAIKTLPPLEDAFRFRSNESLEAEIDFARVYYKNLLEEAAFMLQEEQAVVFALVEHYEKYKYCYWQLIIARTESSCYITRRESLQAVKDTLGNNFYDKGILPYLVPNKRP